MHVQTLKRKHFTISYRSFKDFDETKFFNDILSAPWATIKHFDDIGDILEACLDILVQVVYHHMSIKQHIVNCKNT